MSVMFLSFFGMIFGLLAKFKFGQQLLLKYPKIFSCGFFSHEGPSEETMKNTKFSITFYGQGWPKEDSLTEPTDQYTTPPTKELVTRVSASNPGNSSISRTFAQSFFNFNAIFFCCLSRLRCYLRCTAVVGYNRFE